MHLFLSPHLDDAVLSCGGQIHRLTRERAPVTILTVMAGDPPDPLPDTPIVQELHARWEAGTNPMPARREEDTRAAKRLGAAVYHMPVPDCIYRTGSGRPLYTTEESLFGPVALADAIHRQLMSTPLSLKIDALYVPLGVGHHVDHQIVRDWGLALAETNPKLSVKFYEEYPYTRDPAAVESALQLHSVDLEPESVTLDETDVDAKIEAIACYTSQIGSFWENVHAMGRDVRAVLKATGEGRPAERCWKLME